MERNPKGGRRPLKRILERFAPVGLTTAGIFMGGSAGEMNRADGSLLPRVVPDDTAKREVKELLKAITIHLDYRGEGTKRNATPEEIHKVIRALGSETFAERENASNAIETIVRYQAKPALTKALNDPDPEIVARVRGALEKIQAIDDKRAAQLRPPVQRILGIEPAILIGDKEVVPALRRVLADQDLENKDVKQAVMFALCHIGPEAKASMPELLTALTNKDWEVRCTAALTFGKFRSEAKTAAPALIAAFEDKNPSVRQTVLNTLGSIGLEPNVVVPVFIKGLTDQASDVVLMAAHNLGRLGPKAKDAVPELIVSLKNGSFETRFAAATTLEKIGPNAKEAIPALRDLALSENETEEIRQQARDAIDAIGRERSR